MIHRALHTWIELQEFISVMTHVFAHGAHPPPPFLVPCWVGGGEKRHVHKWSTKPTTNTLMAHLCSRAYKNNVHQTGGGTFAKIVRGCACRTSKTFSIPIFWTIIHPSVSILLVPFSKEKHPIWLKIGCFLPQFAQNTPNLGNLGSFISDKNPPIAIPNFAKQHLKRQAHTCIPCQCENPPGTSGQKNTTRHVCVIAMTRTLPAYVVTPNDSVVT